MGSLIKVINILLRQPDDLDAMADLYQTLNKMNDVIGLNLEVEPLNQEEKALVNEWVNARSNKDFEKADKLRQQINERNIKL